MTFWKVLGAVPDVIRLGSALAETSTNLKVGRTMQQQHPELWQAYQNLEWALMAEKAQPSRAQHEGRAALLCTRRIEGLDYEPFRCFATINSPEMASLVVLPVPELPQSALPSMGELASGVNRMLPVGGLYVHADGSGGSLRYRAELPLNPRGAAPQREIFRQFVRSAVDASVLMQPGLEVLARNGSSAQAMDAIARKGRAVRAYPGSSSQVLTVIGAALRQLNLRGMPLPGNAGYRIEGLGGQLATCTVSYANGYILVDLQLNRRAPQGRGAELFSLATLANGRIGHWGFLSFDAQTGEIRYHAGMNVGGCEQLLHGGLLSSLITSTNDAAQMPLTAAWHVCEGDRAVFGIRRAVYAEMAEAPGVGDALLNYWGIGADSSLATQSAANTAQLERVSAAPASSAESELMTSCPACRKLVAVAPTCSACGAALSKQVRAATPPTPAPDETLVECPACHQRVKPGPACRSCGRLLPHSEVVRTAPVASEPQLLTSCPACHKLVTVAATCSACGAALTAQVRAAAPPTPGASTSKPASAAEEPTLLTACPVCSELVAAAATCSSCGAPLFQQAPVAASAGLAPVAKAIKEAPPAKREQVVCPYCHQQVMPGPACRQCGRLLPPGLWPATGAPATASRPMTSTVVCPYCGKRVLDGRFCGTCGHRLKE